MNQKQFEQQNPGLKEDMQMQEAIASAELAGTTILDKQLDEAMKQAKDFEDFFNNNKSILIEHAELSTGESMEGQEPLLTIDAVKEIAQECWDDK